MIGLADEASADLANIARFSTGLYGAAVAVRTGRRIFAALRRLEKAPYLGRAGREPGTREWVIAPYIVIYAPVQGGIAVYRVIHGAMLWPPG